MPFLKLSELLKVAPDVWFKSDAVDPLMGFDLPLFVDPRLFPGAKTAVFAFTKWVRHASDAFLAKPWRPG